MTLFAVRGATFIDQCSGALNPLVDNPEVLTTDPESIELSFGVDVFGRSAPGCDPTWSITVSRIDFGFMTKDESGRFLVDPGQFRIFVSLLKKAELVLEPDGPPQFSSAFDGSKRAPRSFIVGAVTVPWETGGRRNIVAEEPTDWFLSEVTRTKKFKGPWRRRGVSGPSEKITINVTKILKKWASEDIQDFGFQISPSEKQIKYLRNGGIFSFHQDYHVYLVATMKR